MEAKRDIELTERQRYWLTHIRRDWEQRMSMAAYAREQGLNVAALYYWKKRLLANRGGQGPEKAVDLMRTGMRGFPSGPETIKPKCLKQRPDICVQPIFLPTFQSLQCGTDHI